MSYLKGNWGRHASRCTSHAFFSAILRILETDAAFQMSKEWRRETCMFMIEEYVRNNQQGKLKKWGSRRRQRE
jgi:hypothetical protein